MKTSILLKTFLIFFLILNGCSKESLVGVKKDDTSKGSIELKINKNAAPPEVQQITALLTRQDYDTLRTSIDVNNDSLNIISFQNILIGGWHLTVEAENSEGKIIYRGVKDITILEDETIDVYITLTPTGNGKGNINIYVNWGKNSWVDYYSNPIFDNPSIPYGVAQCKIIFDDNKYKMWYTGLYNSGQAEIWYVESSDGINWNESTSYSVLQKGELGTWDDYRVGVGAVLKDSNNYKMYYYGWQDQYSIWQIGLAVSNDGINWEKYPEPVLPANEIEFQVGVSDVVKKDNTYYIFYSYRSDAYTDNYKISLATSADGITWNRCNQNPIISATVQWEGNSISYPTVIFDNNKFLMMYQSEDRTAFGLATSEDGINWIKNESNPIFNLSSVVNHWTSFIYYPFLRKFNNEYRVYYTGRDNNNILQLGVARK